MGTIECKIGDATYQTIMHNTVILISTMVTQSDSTNFSNSKAKHKCRFKFPKVVEQIVISLQLSFDPLNKEAQSRTCFLPAGELLSQQRAKKKRRGKKR